MDFIADIQSFFDYMVNDLFLPGLQFFIDFIQLWFGIGPYGQYAPEFYMLILIIILVTVGKRALNEVSIDTVFSYYHKSNKQYKNYRKKNR